MVIKNKFKKYLPWIITGLIILIFYYIGTTIPESSIRKMIIEAGVFGPIIFIILTLITFIFAPLSGTPFIFAGFYAFGQKVVIYSFIASLLSFIVNFYIAKKWGRLLVGKLAGQENLEKVDKYTQNYGFVTLFFLRLFLNAFHDGISYAFGLTSIKFTSYFLVSLSGALPNFIFWYFISTKINNPFTYTTLHIVLAYLFLLVYLGWLLAKRKIKKRKKR